MAAVRSVGQTLPQAPRSGAEPRAAKRAWRAGLTAASTGAMRNAWSGPQGPSLIAHAPKAHSGWRRVSAARFHRKHLSTGEGVQVVLYSYLF
jgi:hypothetical protein